MTDVTGGKPGAIESLGVDFDFVRSSATVTPQSVHGKNW
jgi:hypothetical protein